MTTDIPTMSLAADLRRFIDETFLFGVDTPYSDADSFMENSIIDSTGVLELIAHLESTYQLHIADEDLVPENLDSVSNLVDFINRKRATSSTPVVE